MLLVLQICLTHFLWIFLVKIYKTYILYKLRFLLWLSNLISIASECQTRYKSDICLSVKTHLETNLCSTRRFNKSLNIYSWPSFFSFLFCKERYLSYYHFERLWFVLRSENRNCQFSNSSRYIKTIRNQMFLVGCVYSSTIYLGCYLPLIYSRKKIIEELSARLRQWRMMVQHGIHLRRKKINNTCQFVYDL